MHAQHEELIRAEDGIDGHLTIGLLTVRCLSHGRILSE